MANREKGEIRLEVGDRTYRLVLNTNAMAIAEGAISTPTHDVFWDELWAKATKGSVRHLRALLFGMLQKFHPEVTLAGVGRLIDELGGLVGLAQVLSEAMAAASPEPSDLQTVRGSAAPADPPTARAGTGASSTRPPAA